MTYEEFEDAIYNHIADNWNSDDAVLISEYRVLSSSEKSTLEVTIGVESDEVTFGNIDGNKKLNIQSGTVNLTLSYSSDIGSVEALRIIGLARGLFHNVNIQGYIQFDGAIKKNFRTRDGKLLKLIVCPFTVQIIE